MSHLALVRAALAALVLFLGLALAAPGSAGVLPVSPGDPDRLVEATDACPTFSWSGTPGAVGYELAVLDLSDAESPTLVFSQRIDGSGDSWTPSRDRCLAPGRTYAWLVRADLAVSGLGEWSAPRRFHVPGAPTTEEVDAALALLARWRAAQPRGSDPGAGGDPGAVAAQPSALRGQHATAAGDAPLATGVAAIRGEIPDLTGSAYGVLGISHSTQGAGVVARNEGEGPDLVLDGAAASVPDTHLSEKSLDRPSASAETFEFLNSGGGGMSLAVDGTAVSLAGHTHSGSAIVSGTVADARIAATLARDSEVMGIVLANDGAGSGLEADTLDGLHAAAVQERVTGSCPPGSALLAIHADGSVDCQELPLPPRVTTLAAGTAYDCCVSLALGTDGFPRIAFYDSVLNALRLIVCRDAACASGNETITTVDDPANYVGKFASIAIGTDGFPIIAYQDVTAYALKVVKCGNSTCSSRTITTLEDTDSILAQTTSIAIGTDGFAVIAYYDQTAHALKVAKCGNAACTAATITTVHDVVNQVGSDSSIAIGADGFPVISYLDSTAYALIVAKCNDAACAGGGETFTTVDEESASVGWDSSLEIGADGFPVISYRDYANRTLKIAKCDDPACAAGGESLTTVDNPTNEVGGSTSLVLDAGGLPVVSHRDDTFGDLKLVRCNDAACTGGDETIVTVDASANDVGESTSIAIGADGFPVIAYRDVTAHAVKVAKCRNPTCTY